MANLRSTQRRTAAGGSHIRQFAWQATFLLLILCALPITSGATDEVHRRTGRVAICSPFSPIIAVDLRDGDMGGFVVGKIVADSILQRGGQPIGLHDIIVGEIVKITWRKSAQGTEILTVLADKDPAPPPAKHQPLLRKPEDADGLIGHSRRHKVRKKETLLDIARRYGLGYNEIVALYPHYDPWLPPVGEVLEIPSQWLLPHAAYEGLVINIPEMRLFAYLHEESDQVARTYPIGIGDTDFPTPTGTFRIGAKRVHPTWYVPPSLRAKYQQASFPPGPDNPLGDYWISLADTMYGIHGTDIPWSVGRLVTRGCIRMYPEDIAKFFPAVSQGMEVRLVYQPVKAALISGRLLIEVHSDIYSRVDNLAVHGLAIIEKLGLAHLLDESKFVSAIARQDGMPRDITRESYGESRTAINDKEE